MKPAASSYFGVNHAAFPVSLWRIFSTCLQRLRWGYFTYYQVYLEGKSEYLVSCSYHPASLLWKLGQAGYRCQPVLIYLDALCGHDCTTKVHIWNNLGLTVGIHALLLPAVTFSDPELCTHPRNAEMCVRGLHTEECTGANDRSQHEFYCCEEPEERKEAHEADSCKV